MKLIVVESPSKAKTLKGYLDGSYEVVASIGHFRDLPESGIGIEEDNNFQVTEWKVDSEKINPVIKLVKKADEIFLAPDPDREGELIAWHLLELFKEKNIIKHKKISRIEFNQVNKNSVLNAIDNPREININLVNAALARRFLDRFFGYKISPITQRRTIFGKSAGRVQSPALRILAKREEEIDRFIPEEFWDIQIELLTSNNEKCEFKLLTIGEKKIVKLSIKSETEAKKIVKDIENRIFNIESIEKKEKKRNPYPPFTTSTLQQEASNKFSFSPSITNLLAQQLFDGSALKSSEKIGLITYHRTDDISLPTEIIQNCRNIISHNFGDSYLPPSYNHYKNKVKNAQEAHEPIRPTDLERSPDMIKNDLSENHYKLYELIWKRTIASQMLPSLSQETSVIIKSEEVTLRTSGSIPSFDGFKKVYNYSDNQDKNKNILPNFKKNEQLKISKINEKQNFTLPPNRYSEAGLIKKLEELGIGRPSTYAAIVQKLIKNNYVEIKNKSMIPNAKGKILSKFLENFFNNFVEYEFTANLEEQLDHITKANKDWKKILEDFLFILNKTINDVEKKSITDVINIITEKSDEFFEDRNCPKCKKGQLTIKFSYTGPFIGCSEYNKKDNGCRYSSSLDDRDLKNQLIDGEKLLGVNPETKKEILLKKGKYGLYLEMQTEDEKLKRTAIPKNLSIDEVTLEKSISLLKLPREVGIHPDSGQKIIASIGPYGPYIKHDNKFVSLKQGDDVLFIGIDRSIHLIAEKAALNKEIEIGLEPNTKKKIILKKGIKGRPDYISFNKKNYSLSKEMNEKKVSLEEALEIINAKVQIKKKKKTKTIRKK